MFFVSSCESIFDLPYSSFMGSPDTFPLRPATPRNTGRIDTISLAVSTILVRALLSCEKVITRKLQRFSRFVARYFIALFSWISGIDIGLSDFLCAELRFEEMWILIIYRSQIRQRVQVNPLCCTTFLDTPPSRPTYQANQ